MVRGRRVGHRNNDILLGLDGKGLAAHQQCAVTCCGTYFYACLIHIDVDESVGCVYVALYPFEVTQCGANLKFLIAGLGRTDAQVVFP